MTDQIEILDGAVKYILFQRTDHIAFNKTILYKVIRKIMPFISYRWLVGIEAKIRASSIKALYIHDMQKEYLTIKQFLPRDCERILDIGCGIAGIDLYLESHYSDKRVDFFLLDKTRIDKKVFYKFKKTGAFYNSLNIAKANLVRNGVDAARINILDATEDGNIEISGKVELIISLISWGFHYPVETYLERAFQLLDVNGTLIIDIRRGTGGLELLADKFRNYEIMMEEKTYLRVCAHK